MGRLLGYHADEQELDRPDLNKCPDCGCYFPQLNCPLCGKECPENMRAGNRVAVKPAKRKHNGQSNRVVFINWYHTPLVIVLAMLFFPIIGIILLLTSPHSKSVKIVGTVVGALILAVSYIGVSTIVSWVNHMFEKPVDTSLTREEYLAECTAITSEEFYRSADSYSGAFVSFEVKILTKVTDWNGSEAGNRYPTYYLCTPTDGCEYTILLRNCLVDSQMNFIPGDVITVYGEGGGVKTVTDDSTWMDHTAPCLNMAYFIRGK